MSDVEDLVRLLRCRAACCVRCRRMLTRAPSIGRDPSTGRDLVGLVRMPSGGTEPRRGSGCRAGRTATAAEPEGVRQPGRSGGARSSVGWCGAAVRGRRARAVVRWARRHAAAAAASCAGCGCRCGWRTTVGWWGRCGGMWRTQPVVGGRLGTPHPPGWTMRRTQPDIGDRLGTPLPRSPRGPAPPERCAHTAGRKAYRTSPRSAVPYGHAHQLERQRRVRCRTSSRPAVRAARRGGSAPRAVDRGHGRVGGRRPPAASVHPRSVSWLRCSALRRGRGRR